MPSSIDIDEDLLAEVMAISGAKNRKQAVDIALRNHLRHVKAMQPLLALQGKLEWESVLDAVRRDQQG
jgi:Arc/MetJ family transcription regulator